MALFYLWFLQQLIKTAPDNQKKQIIKENKAKSDIYCCSPALVCMHNKGAFSSLHNFVTKAGNWGGVKIAPPPGSSL
jgi:hypothetical protein